MRSLDAWYQSPEYQPLIALRKACTSDLDMLITLEGRLTHSTLMPASLMNAP